VIAIVAFYSIIQTDAPVQLVETRQRPTASSPNAPQDSSAAMSNQPPVAIYVPSGENASKSATSPAAAIAARETFVNTDLGVVRKEQLADPTKKIDPRVRIEAMSITNKNRIENPYEGANKEFVETPQVVDAKPTTESSANVPAYSDAGKTSTAPQPPAQNVLSTQSTTSKLADADELLAQFTSAFETGSLTSLKNSFSNSMAGKAALLEDYERVFNRTKHRSIRFSRMRHSVVGPDRFLSTGHAVVATVDYDNRSTQQRVFLEIEIAREAGRARIARIANYEQQ
jgi:hypothetical protein